jgi:hypothetical protein
MTLTRLLFEPTLVRSPLRIIRWWESRRLTYNAVVGATGVATLLYVNALELILDQGVLSVPWYAVAAYALAANVCYTFGPAVEIVLERWLKRPLYGVGPALFRHGLVFSVGLTLLPAGLITLVNVLGRIFAP